MSLSQLPKQPEALAAFEYAFIGTSALAYLGHANLRTDPVVLVHASEQQLLEVLHGSEPCEHAFGGIKFGDLSVVAAPDGLEATLRQMRCPIAAIGIRSDGSVIDPHDGVKALTAKRLEVSSDGFGSEPSNLLRVAALASELAVSVSEPVRLAMKAAADRVFQIPRREIRHYLTRLLVGRRAGDGLRLLQQTGILPYILPEASALVGFHRSSKHHHKDVWAHTCTVVDQAVPQPIIRWAALLHDIGKVHTRSYSGRRKVHFLRHDDVGAVMFEGIAHRLKFGAYASERIRLLILHHLRPGLYTPAWSDAAVRRFATDMDEFLGDLLALARADITSKIPGRRKQALENLHELKTRIEKVQAQELLRKPCVPKGLGSLIISELGIVPGPAVGELRRVCEQAVRDGRLEAEPEMNACIEFLRRHLAA